MQKEHLPIYQIQDFRAAAEKEHYFYFSSLSRHLQQHLFIQEPHKHNFYIILFISRGTGTHTIDFVEHEVKPGTFFFLTPGQVHSWSLSGDAEGVVIFFSQEFYNREYPHRMLPDFPFFNALVPRPVLPVSEAESAALQPVLHLLEQEYETAGQVRDVLLSRYLDILLIKLSQLFRPQETTSDAWQKERALLQNLERLIEQHYKEHLPISYYAERLNVTAKHLNEVCKRSLNQTTHELIQHRVLLEAKRLLVHSGLTSSQIAAELGYFDNTYFFRFFKKHAGYTPEQFRAAHKRAG